jgi:copper chaperone for superoxide dismutase
MHCQGCADSVKRALEPFTSKGLIESVDCDVANQLVSITGSQAPSAVVRAIQSSGKDAIVRGTGKPNSAAVCILESFLAKDKVLPVKGLARIVSVSPTQALFDITLDGLPKGTYYPSIRVSGDISQGPLSVGGQYLDLGSIDVKEANDRPAMLEGMSSGGFSGQAFFKKDVSITEVIGRSIIVSDSPDHRPTESSLVGVIARSAGIWQNLKTVCSCSGKTVWQERRDAVSKGLST